MRTGQITISVLCLLLAIFTSSGQDFNELPILKPSNISAFDIDAGLPISCTYNAIYDKTGRLWINPCYGQLEHKTINFYQYNGKTAHVVQWDSLPPGIHGQAALSGITDEGIFYGFFRESDGFFFFNPNTHQTQFLSLQNKEASIQYIGVDDRRQLVIFAHARDKYLIYRLEDNHSQLLLSLQGDSTYAEFKFGESWFQRKYLETCLQSGENFWFLKGFQLPITDEKNLNTLTLVKANLETKEISEYPLNFFLENDTLFDRGSSLETSKIYADSEGNIFVLLMPWAKIFVLDPNSGKISSKPFFPKAPNTTVYPLDQPVLVKDSKGNFLYLYKYLEKEYQAILLDNTGKYFNYSQVINDAIKFTRYMDGPINDVLGNDFKEKITVLTSGGLAIVSLQLSNAIHNYMEDISTRAISEIAPGKYIVQAEKYGTIRLEPHVFPESSVTASIPQYSSGKILLDNSNIRKNIDGSCYFPITEKNKELVKLSPDGKFEGYRVGVNFEKFDFINAHKIVLASGQQLYLYDLNTSKLLPFLIDGKPFLINPKQISEIYTAKNGLVWIATLNGLWQVDINAGKSRRFGLEESFHDERFMCLHEDDSGRLWIGTFAAGLHIFDPKTEQVTVIDQKEGLSNNTVIGILADSTGIRWLATYNGITLISPGGKILKKLFRADGLSTNEFNRNSYFKDSKGNLLFGSVNGVNIIDPEAVKRQILNTRDLNIYLTGITFFDPKKNGETTINNGFDSSTELHLDAAHRYLKIDYALTSMIRSGENNFSYKIEDLNQQNSTWNFIGSNTQLNLYNLAPGKFNIFIRGSDYRGNLTPRPIVILVHAKEFFYKELWFYGVIALLLASLVVAWIIRNMSERVRLQKMVADRTKKITEDKMVIEEQAIKLKEMDLAKSRFFTNISHEFRTPLTVIAGMANQIKENPNQWTTKGIDLIQRNCDDLLSLINQILDLRKLESGTYKINPVQQNIVPYLHYIVESFTSIAAVKGITIHFISNINELSMDFDPEKFMHILSNLLSNAIKFTPNQGNIFIEIKNNRINKDEILEIQVKDTGKGISAEALPYIFDRFYQVEDLASQKPMGSGIGLSLVNELVTILGGTIKAESTLGVGTTFILCFPVTRNQPVSESGGLISGELQRGTTSVIPIEESQSITDVPIEINPVTMLPKETNSQSDLPVLLVVEDNTDVLQYLTTCLATEYRLILATDGQQGIDKAIEWVPDLIVSDVMMPVKDGFVLCDTLKNDQRTSHIPIILLTAKADQKSKITGLRKGADAYLAKPFEKEELLIRLKNMLTLRNRLQQRYQNLDALIDSPSEEYLLEDIFIQRFRELVLKNIAEEKWGVNDICLALGISRTQVHNKVTALTGKSTTHLIRSIRLHKAKELLKNTELNVSEISYEIGIGNPNYFSRIYSEEFGESPSKTRNQ